VACSIINAASPSIQGHVTSRSKQAFSFGVHSPFYLHILNYSKLQRVEQEKKKAVVIIQKYYRGYLGRIRVQKMRLEQEERKRELLRQMERAALIIQAVYRGFIVRLRLQRERDAPPPSDEEINAAVVIQAHWRGYWTRKQIQLDLSQFL
jgi:hypothetical protein